MVRQEFLVTAKAEVRRLQFLYGLESWDIIIRVVHDDAIPSHRAAEVSIKEPYRYAIIEFAESTVEQGSERSLMHVIQHEMQHVFLHPLDALRDLVMDALPENMRVLLANEFLRTGERLRASVEFLGDKMAAELFRRQQDEVATEISLSN